MARQKQKYDPTAFSSMPTKPVRKKKLKKLVRKKKLRKASLVHNEKFKIQEYQLEYRKRLPFWMKIKMSLNRIRYWHDYFGGNVYVSFSGGKDSQVLLHLVRRNFPNITAVFFDTGLEYPEIRRTIKSTENVEIVKPQYTFKEVINKYGWPIISKRVAQYVSEVRTTKSDILRKLRMEGIDRNGNKKAYAMIPLRWQFLVEAPFDISHKCCTVMKKKPSYDYYKKTGKVPFVGICTDESKQRELSYLQHGCFAFHKSREPVSWPISFWTEQDILRYVHEHDIPLASVYGEVRKREYGYELTGISSTGCMWCGFGAHMEDRPNRFETMKDDYPKQYRYIMEKLHMNEVLDFIKIPY